MIPKVDGFSLEFLPAVPERWTSLIKDRRGRMAQVARDLQALVDAGASPCEIAALAPGYHYAAHVEFRGLSLGLTKRETSAMDTPLQALWLLDLLEEPQDVLAILGIKREEMVRALLEHRPVNEWLRKGPQLGISHEIWGMIGPEGLMWKGSTPLPEFPWPISSLGDGLQMEDGVGPVPILQGLTWQGTLRLKNWQNLGALHLGGGPALIIEDCPGLSSLTMGSPLEQVEVRNCPDLQAIVIPRQAAESYVPGRPPSIRTEGEKVLVEYPASPSRTRDHALLVEACPKLSRLEAGFGALTIRECHALKAVRHRGGPLEISDCAGLDQVRMEDGDVNVSACPELKSLRRGGTGKLVVEDCRALIRIETAFPTTRTPSAQVRLRSCPQLREIRSQTPALRQCGPMEIVDCPNLQLPVPHLHIHKDLHLSGCPAWEATPRTSKKTGWLIGHGQASPQDGDYPGGEHA